MYRYKITAVLFLVMVFAIGARMMIQMGGFLGRAAANRISVLFVQAANADVMIQSAEKKQPPIDSNPLAEAPEKEDKQLSFALRAIRRIESEFTTSFVQKISFIELHGLFQRLLGRRTVDDVDETRSIIQDTHHRLYFPFPPVQRQIPEKQAATIVDFHRFLTAHNVSFMYVLPPCKVNPDAKDLPEGVQVFSNEICDVLLSRIKRDGVPVIDLKEEAKKDKLDWYSLYYRTDHHWTIDTAFWAHCKVVERFNSEFGWNMDPDYSKRDHKNYERITHENFFLGSIGKRVGKYYVGVDDFSYSVPKYETDLSVKMIYKNRIDEKSGTFEKAIVKKEMVDESAPLDKNRYAVYFGGDHPLVEIANPRGQGRILVIQDSYGLPISAFLSLHFKEMCIVDLRHFQGSIREYAANGSFDAVLILYNADSLASGNEIMFSRLYE